MSSRKPPSNQQDWDDFDIPTWDDSGTGAPSRKYPPASQPASNRGSYPDPLYDDYGSPPAPSRSSSRPPSTNVPPVRLSNRVPTRSTRPSQDPYRDPYSDFDSDYASVPYDPRAPEYGTAPRPGVATSQYDLYAQPSYDATWDEAADYQGAPPAARRGRQRTRAERPSVSVPRPAISDQGMAGLVAAALIGLLAMIGVTWWGIGSLAATIPWHLNASGVIDQWVSNTGLWRIPFGVFMTLLIGVVLGAFLWKRDRFAARFIIASMCIVQVLAWVALVDQLW